MQRLIDHSELLHNMHNISFRVNYYRSSIIYCYLGVSSLIYWYGTLLPAVQHRQKGLLYYCCTTSANSKMTRIYWY